MDMLALAIAAILVQFNSEISSIAWDYQDLSCTRKDVLQEAVRAAHSSAIGIAGALNVSLSGIHKLSYEVRGLDSELQIPGRDLAMSRSVVALAASPANLSPRLVFSHTAQISVTVKADFLVAAFTN